MIDVNEFSQIRIGLATADAMRTWSNGEVKKPETINYRTLKPEKDGLFCEKIFGPMKDWECACGKYRRVRFKGIICERCGVEVTRSKVRRERMGHIELAAPAVHIWYLRGTRSWLAYLLSGLETRAELKAKGLERVIYFASNLVTWVDEARRHEDLERLKGELAEELVAIEDDFAGRLADVLAELETDLAEHESADDARVRRAVTKVIAKLDDEFAAAGFVPADGRLIARGIAALHRTADLKAVLAELDAAIASVGVEVDDLERAAVAKRVVRLGKDLAKLKFRPAADPPIADNLAVAHAKGGTAAVIEAVAAQVLEIETELAAAAEAGKARPGSRNSKPFVNKLNVASADVAGIAAGAGRRCVDALAVCRAGVAEVAATSKTKARSPKERELNAIRKAAEARLDDLREELEDEKDLARLTFDTFATMGRRAIVDDEYVWQELVDKYGDYFEGGMGAEAIAQLMARIDFEIEEQEVLDALAVRGRVARVDVERRDKDLAKLQNGVAALKSQDRARLTAESGARKRALATRCLGKLGTALGKLKFRPAGDPPIADNLAAAHRKGGVEAAVAAIDVQVAAIEAEIADEVAAGKGKTRARNAGPFVRRLAAARADLARLEAETDAEVDEAAGAAAVFHDLALEALAGLGDDTVVEDDDIATLLNEHYGDYVSVSPARRPLSQQRKQKAVKRLKILSAFNRRDEHGRLVNDPKALILDAVPVIPPELRPMVQLDGGRFATSDLNDLYRRVINRNNRLKRLLDLSAPDIIINNEKRMLQEAVDALFDNGRRGRAVTGPGGRPLKSLSDMLKGKQGRFRQNLLGKRVDYSGRSVIVAGPTLRLHQCGLPKLMALELFKPFVMKRLVDQEYAQNIKSAKRMVERRRPDVWNVLEDAIKEHPVLLNRAPTLHRLGIQAFEPVLVEGKAIQIHPLVCAAFNADFDGDQMAVHLPLSSEAQAEARVLMLSANNIISPADGRPVTVPSQDMLIGSFYLTAAAPPSRPESRARPVFRHLYQIETAVSAGDVEIGEPIEWRTEKLSAAVRAEAGPDDLPAAGDPLRAAAADGTADGAAADGGYEITTAGRALFNATLPAEFAFVNTQISKTEMGRIVRVLSDEYSTGVVAASLDALKDLCYAYASRSGLTISVDDVVTPPDKAEILERHEREAEKVEGQYRRGIITDGERRQKEVEIWTSATEAVRGSLEREMAKAVGNPIGMMVDSGARGNMMQVRQIAAIRGLVANPRGDIIPRPIKSSYREGLATLEYFISTPGARKGLVDTALRTADSGYLTRRLVDVAQELIINDEDPLAADGRPAGLWLEDVRPDRPDHRTHLETRLFSRCLAADVALADGTVLAAGTLVGDVELAAMRDDPDLTRVQVLSPLTDDSEFGISAKSYGASLATGRLIEVGEAVGVIAAQSIGEPGTQLTMRTFHTGGVAGTDIAAGLPRVVELFEARTPRGKAVLAARSGVVRVGEEDGRGRTIEVVGDDGNADTYTVPAVSRLAVADGQEVRPGDPLVDGPRDPKELVEILGVRDTQQYLVGEVQKVYREQGVSIHDKHIELIVRQMTRRVLVSEPGDAGFHPGDQVDQRVYRNTNSEVVAGGGTPAKARAVIMGITKASLATDSWLSAASFQETTRVLTEAAIESRQDGLHGLKENIIIGKLIPAGTGQGCYRSIETIAPDYEPMEFWSSENGDPDGDPAAAGAAGAGAGAEAG